MQLPYSWIRELVDISWSPEELAERLTLCGIEAEVQHMYEGAFNNMLVAQIAELEKIKGSDHLLRAVVDTGSEKMAVVCGAPNTGMGQKVVLAKVGAGLKDGTIIEKVRLRGVESTGMICSEAEIGLSDDHSGIMVLPDDAPVGTSIKEYLGLDDPVIGLDLTPNRPDLMSALGVVRDVACLAGTKVKRPDFRLTESGGNAADYINVSIEDTEACPRYAARIIRGVKIGPSPWWIKRKLLLCGIRPISNVVDITNLVMMEYGHPLHAFDYDRFNGTEVLVRRAHDGEEFTTLDGRGHTLTPEVLLITNGRRPVAAAGIMGGLDSEVTSETVNILLESAYFNPVTIRRGRQKLGIVSESSTRFEKGADPNIVSVAMDRAAFLIKKYAGGNVLKGIVDCYPKMIHPAVIKLRPDRVNSLLGMNLSVERISNILEGLEFRVKFNQILEVSVPTSCPDVTREIDLIEEIARIEGYDAIPNATCNFGPMITARLPDASLREDVRRLLASQGFDEIYSSGLADARLLAVLDQNAPRLAVVNPLAEDLSAMQNSIIYSLLRTVSHNLSRRNLDLRLFELGKSFHPGDPPTEKDQVGVAISGHHSDRWYAKGRDIDFYDLKGAIDLLLEGCRIASVEFIPERISPYRDDLSFSLKIGNKSIGCAGLVTEYAARAFDIKQAVFTAAIDFESLLQTRQSEIAYAPLPRYPSAPRDIAVVVDESIKAGELLEAIRLAGGDLLENAEIFDLYRGRQIPEGKKSLAFALLFRASERSLSGEEVIEIYDKIADYLKKNFSAEVREG
jgi:phenylalanyl-tRNA synthetase beta chain